jgi:hypothetical protein
VGEGVWGVHICSIVTKYSSFCVKDSINLKTQKLKPPHTKMGGEV